MKTPFFFLIALLVLALTSCSKSDPPVITTLTATPGEIFTFEETVLFCEAQASLDMQVDYKWSCDHGEIVGSDSDQTVIWLAPSEPGAYEINVEVSDGIKSTVGSLSVNVILNDIQYYSFIDSRDGKSYSYTSYKGQSWMSDNLAFLPKVSPAEDESVYEPRYYVYGYQGNDISAAKTLDNYSSYGALYNWAAAQSACPAGWRLPTDDDWKILERNLGMTEAESDEVNWRESGDVGKMLKSRQGWVREGNGFNRIGFSALPGGYRSEGTNFIFVQNKAWFWTSTSESFNNAWYRHLYYQKDGIYRYHHGRDIGCSIRCIKAD